MNIALIITLLVIGLALLLLEIFVVPGIGVSGILGIAALVSGCFFSFRFGVQAGLIVTGVVVLAIALLLWYALREKTWTRFALETKVESSAGQDATIVTVGDTGVTSTRLAPMGTARIAGKSVEVKSLEGMLDPGTKVEVAMIEDNIIYVKEITQTF